MSTLLRKEIREHLVHFLVMALFPIIIAAVLFLMRAFDDGSVGLVLFILTGPSLAFLVGSHLFSAELKNQTLMLLVGLPLSRTRIWLTKICFGLAFCAALYLWFFAFMAMVAGVPRGSLDLLGALILLPAAAFSLGALAGMLPEQFTGLLLALIGLIGAVLTKYNGFLTTMNWPLFSALVIPVPLVASYMAFRRGEMMNCWRRWIWSFGTVAVGMAVVVVVLTSLDVAADARRFTLTEIDAAAGAKASRWETAGAVEGGGVLAVAHVLPPWWDPIQRNFKSSACPMVWGVDAHMTAQVRAFVLYPDTGVVKPVGPRLAAGKPMADGRHVALTVPHRTCGILFENLVTLRYIDLRGEEPDIDIDTNAFALGGTPSGKIVYQRYVRDPVSNAEIAELCVRDPREKQSKVLAVAESSRQPYGMLLASGEAVLWRFKKGNRVEAVRRAEATVHVSVPEIQYQMVSLRGGAPVVLPFSGELERLCNLGDALFVGIEEEVEGGRLAATSVVASAAPDAARLVSAKTLRYVMVAANGQVDPQPWMTADSGLPSHVVGGLGTGRMVGARFLPAPRGSDGNITASYTRAANGRVLEEWERPRDHVITMYDLATRQSADVLTIRHTRDTWIVPSLSRRAVLVGSRDSVDPSSQVWVVTGNANTAAPSATAPTVRGVETPMALDWTVRVEALADERFLLMKQGETWILDANTGNCRRLGTTGGGPR